MTNVRIVEDKLDHKPKGFAYVEFGTIDGLKKALSLSGSSLGGRNIRVSVAEPRKLLDFPVNCLALISLQQRRGNRLATLVTGVEKVLCLICHTSSEEYPSDLHLGTNSTAVRPMQAVIVRLAVGVSRAMENLGISVIGKGRDLYRQWHLLLVAV